MRTVIIYTLFILIPNLVLGRSLSDINILADDTLREPMRQVVEQYVRENYMSVAVQFGSYIGLLDFNNKDTNIIITANKNHLNFLKNNNLIEKDILYITNDPLLVAFSPDIKYDKNVDVTQYLKSICNRARIVIIDPNNSIVGYLSNKLLLSLGIKNFIQVKDYEKAQYLVQNSKAISILNVSGVGEIKNYIKIPEELYDPIQYHIIVLQDKSSENTNSFLKFLLLNKQIFINSGMSANN